MKINLQDKLSASELNESKRVLSERIAGLVRLIGSLDAGSDMWVIADDEGNTYHETGGIGGGWSVCPAQCWRWLLANTIAACCHWSAR